MINNMAAVDTVETTTSPTPSFDWSADEYATQLNTLHRTCERIWAATLG